MDIFALMRVWFEFCFTNPEKISPNHSALYFFCIEHCNRLGWKDKFGLPTEMAKEAIGIKNYRTYQKTLNDLIEFGFIKLIQKSKNQYSSNIITIVKNTKAHTKALDKARQKHSQKQSQSIVSIDIQETLIQETNKYKFNLFYDSEIEKSQNNENYINFVNILFGKNSLSKKLDRVLSMPIQVSFEQFKTIDQYKHNHKVTISDYLVSMENYKDLLKKNTTVQGTLLNWIRRDLKRQQ